MNGTSDNQVLEIRKYANRRLYDATRKCDVTLAELHELVAAGREIRVTDARSEQDITNAILMQMILERDASKLTVFPAAILHQVIRTQQSALGTVVEQFFRQALASHRTSQEQWARFVQSTFGAGSSVGTSAASPTPATAPATAAPQPGTDLADWTRRLFDPFNLTGAAQASPGATRAATPPAPDSTSADPIGKFAADLPTSPARATQADELADLRKLVSDLGRRVEELSRNREK